MAVCQGKLARELFGRRAPGRRGVRKGDGEGGGSDGLVLADVARREARLAARRARRGKGADIVGC